MTNEIDRLKHEEQALMDSDLYSEDYVETLKIEESDSSERVRYVPVAESADKKPQWLPFLAIVGVIWALSVGVIGAGSWWALFLLFPAYKNWQRVQEDRQTGTVDKQTRKALRGAMFALLFVFMFVFDAWGAFFPLLLIEWGLSSIITNRWRRNAVYY